MDVVHTSTASWKEQGEDDYLPNTTNRYSTRQAWKYFFTCANPVKTDDSRELYNFDRHDIVFSKGGYHVLETSEFWSVCS